MYNEIKKIQDFWFETNNVFTDDIIRIYGVDKENEPELYKKIQDLLFRDKKKFFKGQIFTANDTHTKICHLIKLYRTLNKTK